jgi:radical SAM protein with 4Fe4S-binding SPASM domain
MKVGRQSENAMVNVDFDRAPYLVLWELTRACALACRHCRARAMRKRNPDELSFAEARKLLRNLKEFGNHPLIVLTGGDPAQRPDLFEIIAEARQMGFMVAITPSATPTMTENMVARLKKAGIARMAISIDGPDAQTHDSFRRVDGSFDLSMQMAGWGKKYDLPLQVNTTISRHNVHLFERMAAMVESLDVVLWSVFFLVPTGRASGNDMQISAAECEDILKKMVRLAAEGKINIKSTAAPHYRRVLVESGDLRSHQSVNDGKGILFISHTGEIFPSGFLPIPAGNVRADSIVAAYRQHELFRSLRDPSLLKGNCGRCKYKVICGGSRARAYGESGDYLEQDELCAHKC